MAFEGLAERLEAAFKRLRGRGNLSEKDVRDALREVRMALLEADVNYKVAKDFATKVTDRAVGAALADSLTPGQMVIKIVHEELVALMGGAAEKLQTAAKPPTVVLLCGLQGAGKTTHCAKLALWLKNKGHHPVLAACDTYRPAAVQQLQIMGQKAGVPVFAQEGATPVPIAKAALAFAKDHGHDYLLIDTAGRLHIDEALMAELHEIKAALCPSEILLVLDAMTGQDAVNVAASFNETLGLSGLLLTKLDSDTRGGAALSARAVTGKAIKFVGTGEKLGDLEVFHPERMAQRILGMGDVLSLIEKAEQVLDEKKAKEFEAKLSHEQFDLNDMLEQMNQIRRLGSMKDILGMLPGVGKQIREAEIDERRVDRLQALILSMTPGEREKPEIINPSRKKRIAKGSGQRVEDVNRLLQQFQQMRKMMKEMGKHPSKAKLRGKLQGLP